MADRCSFDPLLRGSKWWGERALRQPRTGKCPRLSAQCVIVLISRTTFVSISVLDVFSNSPALGKKCEWPRPRLEYGSTDSIREPCVGSKGLFPLRM